MAWNRLNKPRIGRVISERLSELRDGGAQALPKIHERVFRAKALSKELAINNLPRTFQNKKEQLEGSVLYLDSTAVSQQLSRRRGNFVDAETVDLAAIESAEHCYMRGGYHEAWNRSLVQVLL
jgi:GH15 family glucan-1,4-alpha-glucosidase